jgi:hypothetical protein
MVQLAKSSDAAVQKQALATIRKLVINHSENKSAAAAEGAIPLMVQLAKSSDAVLQRETFLTFVWFEYDYSKMQSAEAAGAIELMCTLLSTSPQIDIALQALNILNKLVCLSSNASKAVSFGALATLTRLKGCNGVSFDKSISEVLSKLSQDPEQANVGTPISSATGSKQAQGHALVESKTAAEAQAAKAAAVYPH